VRRAALPAAALLAILTAPAAVAHEVLHSVERDRAVAVKAFFPDGEVLAYAQYEVYSPSDARIPWQKGRTDRGGWLAFVPDVPGLWRVKVVDATGHGLDVAVDASASPAGTATSTAAFVFRPLVGLAAIAAVFAVLFKVYRRKGTGQ
jgi:nickel transport protein